MKTLSPSSNFLSLLVILLAFSFLNPYPTVFGKHNKAGGHHKPPGEVKPAEPVPPQGLPAGPRPDTTYEIHILNHASADTDAINVACNPGPPLNGPPPTKPPAGPLVPPHLLNANERFSWTFEYSDPNADIEYTCNVDWTGHNQGLVSLFDKDTYTDAVCKSDKGNNCYWAIAPDGFYISREDAPFPGPAWTFRWPWGM